MMLRIPDIAQRYPSRQAGRPMTRTLASSEKLNALLIHPVVATRLQGVQMFSSLVFLK